MLKLRNHFLVLLIALSPVISFAQSDNSAIFRFLETTPSARAAALGGNHVGIYEANSSLVYLNPAYLTPETSKMISASFVNYLSDARFGFANGAYHFEGVGTLGFGIRFAGYGDMDLLDESGNDLGDFNANDLALTTALSTKLTDKLSAGAGFDFIHSSYHIYNSTALSASGGLYYIDRDSRFSAGLSFRNLGEQLSYFNGSREDLPFDVSLGISKKPEKFPFQINLTLRQLNNWDMRVYGEDSTPGFLDNAFRHVILGGEAALGQNFHFRLGYNRYLHEQTKTDRTIDLAGVGIGIGMNIKGIIVDISRSSYSRVGGILQISVRSQLR